MDKIIEPLKYRPRKNPHAVQGIISAVLGGITWVISAVICLLAFGEDGSLGVIAGAIGLAVILFSFVGVIYGIKGCMEDEHRHWIAVLGIFMNGIVLLGLTAVFVMGMNQL